MIKSILIETKSAFIVGLLGAFMVTIAQIPTLYAVIFDGLLIEKSTAFLFIGGLSFLTFTAYVQRNQLFFWINCSGIVINSLLITCG
jgi:hypothetical protein